MPPQLPRTDRFEVIDRLGSGAFGVVYEARDRQLERDVALKVLSQPDPDRIYAFKQEFRSLADLAHPNLVELIQLFQEGEL